MSGRNLLILRRRPLFEAARGQNMSEMGKYLTTNHNLEEADLDGYTPLMLACKFLWLEGAQKLIEAGAQLETTHKYFQDTALIVAVSVNAVKCMRYLVKQGANLEARDCNDRTALMVACNRSVGSLKFLIKAGANLEARDFRGETALVWTGRCQQRKSFIILLKAGAEIQITEANQQSLEEVWKGDEEICALIRERRFIKECQMSKAKLVGEVNMSIVKGRLENSRRRKI